MWIDVQIAFGLDREVDEAVLGEQGEHVIEETDAGGEVRLAGAVEIQRQLDRGLGSLALKARRAGRSVGFDDSSHIGFGALAHDLTAGAVSSVRWPRPSAAAASARSYPDRGS